MKRLLILAAAGAAATLVTVAPANAQNWRWNQGGWRTVAYTRVDGRDTDTIRLRGHIRERAIRVCAINQPLHLRDFDIRYQNGGHQDVNTRAVLRAGTTPRIAPAALAPLGFSPRRATSRRDRKHEP